MTQATLSNLHLIEYIEELGYYPFAVKLNKCMWSCNTLDYLFSKVWAPNNTENLNLSVFNMVTGINESKILTNYISCKYKCKFDGRKCNSNQKWNNNNCWSECKNQKNMIVKNIVFGILLDIV